MRKSTTLALALAYLGLGGLVVAEVADLVPRPVPPAPAMNPGTEAPDAAPGPAATAGAAAIRAALTRPLFHPDRRPFVAPTPPDQAPAPAAPAPPPPGYRLRGIVLTAGDRAALVEAPGATDYLEVGEGSTLAGWTVSGIAADHLVLSQGRQTMRLELLPPDAPGTATRRRLPEQTPRASARRLAAPSHPTPEPEASSR